MRGERGEHRHVGGGLSDLERHLGREPERRTERRVTAGRRELGHRTRVDAVVVVGDQAGLFGRGTVGEGNDTMTLALPGVQRELVEAVLGTDLKVPTLDGPVTLRVPPGTPSGRKLRARGKGVVRKEGQAGDLIVTVDIQIPAGVTGEARDALEKFAKLTPPPARERLDARLRRAG